MATPLATAFVRLRYTTAGSRQDAERQIERDTRALGGSAAKAFAEAFDRVLAARLRDFPVGPSASQTRRQGQQSGAGFADGFRAQIESAARRVRPMRVEVDSAAASAGLSRVSDQVDDLNRKKVRVDVDRSARSLFSGGGFSLPDPSRFTLLAGSIAAVTPPLVAMAGSAGLASTSVVALGSAVIGTITAAAAMKFAFGGLVEALKASEAAEKSAVTAGATAAAQRLSQARALRGAQDAVADAGRNLVRAQREEAAAQLDVNRARADALADLQDLRDLVSDLARDEEGAAIALERARKRQADVNKDALSTALDRREAAHDVAVAEDRLKDIQRDRSRRTKELTAREKAGVKGAANVVAAQKRLAAAHAATVDAQRRVARANRDLAETKMAQTFAGGSAAAATLAAKLAELSPAARELYRWIKANEAGFAAFRRRVEQATLPGFTDFLRDVSRRGRSGSSALDIMQRATVDLGRVVGDTADELGDFMRSEYFKGRLKRITDENRKSFQNLNDTVVILARPFARLFAASAPQLTRLTGYVEKLADRFSDWLDTFSDRELTDFFRRAGDELARWWGIAVNLGRIVLGVFKASLPSGSDLVTRLGEFTDRVADWVHSKEGQERIRRFFEFFRDIDYGKMAKIVGQAVALAGLFKAGGFIAKHPVLTLLGALAAQYPQETADFLETATDAIGGVLKWVNDHPVAATTLLAILAAYKALGAVGNIKLPKLPSIGSGGARTSVMNVTATTVNVVGGGGALPGAGGVDPKTGKRRRGMSARTGGKITAGVAVGSFLAMWIGEDAVEYVSSGAIWGDVWGMLKKGAKKKPFEWEAGLIGDLFGGMGKGMKRWFSHSLPEFFLSPEDLKKHGGGWSGFWKDFVEDLSDPLAQILLTTPLGVLGADLIQGLWDGAADKLKELRDWITDKFWNFVGPALSEALGVKSPSTKTKPMGADLIGGLLQGARDGVTNLVSWVGQKLWSNIGGAIKSALGVASPSTKTKPMGADLISGIRVGVAGAIPAALKAMASTGLRLVKSLTSPFARVGELLAPFVLRALKWIDANVIARINTLLGTLHLAKIPPIVGKGGGKGRWESKASGGILPGYSPGRDIHRFVSPTGGVLDLSGYESVMRPEFTKAVGPGFVNGANAAARTGGVSGVRNFLGGEQAHGFADGGVISHLKRAVGRFANEVIPDPGLIRTLGVYALTKVPGAAKRMLTSGVGQPGDWPSSPAAQRGDSGVWKSIVALIKGSGIRQGAFGNAYRDGDPKWHGSGRAVDWMGYNMDALASFLAARKPLELIHRTNKRDYAFTRGRNMGSFDESLMEAHRNHIHIAMAQGGILRKLAARVPVFDGGGVLDPGLNLVDNRTGAREHLVPAAAGGAVHFHFHGPVSSKRGAQEMVLDAYNQLKRERRIK